MDKRTEDKIIQEKLERLAGMNIYLPYELCRELAITGQVERELSEVKRKIEELRNSEMKP